MLDKTVVREMRTHYRIWNVAEEKARAEDAMRRTPEENLRAFVELCDFCAGFRKEPPPAEPRLELIAYHERVARLEAWRRDHGKRP